MTTSVVAEGAPVPAPLAPPAGPAVPPDGTVLSIRHLSKTFPGQRALIGVDLAVRAGEIHALLGQNGSGKSTLIKVLAGYHAPDPGAEILVGGSALRVGVAGAGHELGIRFVHQDLGLVNDLNVIDNLALGHGYRTGRLGRIRWRAEVERARGAMAAVGMPVDVRAPVASLSLAERSGVAIARALHDDERPTRVLVLDEPTAALPADDVTRLFATLRRLRDRGVGIVLVSHDLDEVLEVADHVSVLRDGRLVASVPRDQLDHDELVQLIVGRAAVAALRAVTTAAPAEGTPSAVGEPCLQARGLLSRNLAGLSLAVAPGEIVGVAGLEGSGRESIIPVVTGQQRRLGGEVVVGGTAIPPYAPDRALRAGLAFVPRERKEVGLLPGMNVRENLTIADLQGFVTARRVRKGTEVAETAQWIERLRIVTVGPEAPIATLSGGNQQKVLLARSLRLEPAVLLLDEPTQGVDVGARAEVHRIIDDAAAQGMGALVASTDSEELVRLCHRVLVLQQGRIVRVLHRGADLTVEELNHAQLARTPGTERA
jgi:ribose transport system ATP-binding protein